MFIYRDGGWYPEVLQGERKILPGGTVFTIEINNDVSIHAPDAIKLIQEPPLSLPEVCRFDKEEKEMIDRILTYDKIRKEKNFGIVIHGAPGCGKTVTANFIATMTEKPVIKITEGISYQLLDKIAMATGGEGVVFLFDESDKKDTGDRNTRAIELSGGGFLKFLEGANVEAKKMCIFCANSQEPFDAAVKSRPSRIRYWMKKEGENFQYILDTLIAKKIEEKKAKEIYRFIMDNFKLITKDSVNSFIEEILAFPEYNLYDLSQHMNIEVKNDRKFKDVQVGKGLDLGLTIGQFANQAVKASGKTLEQVVAEIDKIYKKKSDPLQKIYRTMGVELDDVESEEDEGFDFSALYQEQSA